MRTLIALATAAALAGCQPAPPAQVFRTTASIQDIMQSIVDPAADALWESVSSTVTAQGVDEHRPETDEDWKALRHHAIQLAEAANLLAIDGRPVVHAGRQLEDAHVSVTLKSDAIEALLAKDRATFTSHARNLQAGAEEALRAIDARDLTAFTKAGAQIDIACEACHLTFWYPNDKRPAELRAAGK